MGYVVIATSTINLGMFKVDKDAAYVADRGLMSILGYLVFDSLFFLVEYL